MTATTITAPVTVKPVNFTNNQEAREALNTFREAKAAEKAAKERKEQAEAILREALGDAKSAIILGQTVLKVSSLRERKSTDAKALQAGWPEAYQATLKVSTYDFLIES
jgi:hypothetical protein